MATCIRIARRIICLALLLLPAASAEAQQLCYAYDRLGRLSGVIDANDHAAFYDYDAVGNILAIRRKSPSGPVTIYSIDVPAGAPGDRVEIFGVGFSAVAAQNQVTIGGVPAPVVSTLPCTLVVEVPSNAISGGIRLVTPSGEAEADQAFEVQRFEIGASALSTLLNTTVQYTVTSNGCSDPAVIWRVNGIVGGNATIGTISTAGVYTTPAVIPTPSFVVIRAESVLCTNLFAEKTLSIVREFTTFVFASASANHGDLPMIYPPNVVMHRASAQRGSPAAEFPAGTVISSASAANVPVIASVTPATRPRGSAFAMTITGTNLAGATGVTFLGASTPDATITISNVNVDPAGTTLTATVSISATTVVGTRIIRIDRPGGNSTAVGTGANVFTITQ